jgi:hypothetical protein
MIRLWCRLFGHDWKPRGWLGDTGWVCRRCRRKGRDMPT